MGFSKLRGTFLVYGTATLFLAQGSAKAQSAASTPPVAAAAPVAPQETPPPPLADAPLADDQSHDHMMAIPNGPTLHIRGFFDFDYDVGSVAQELQYPLGVPAHGSFRAGEFDLFISSQLQEKLNFLSEVVFSTDPSNNFGVDLERFQLTYRPTRYFEISVGRFHTDIGYYNTAFHHGTWFSTATSRPFVYFFEDSGGVLPIHELGVTTTGYVPSGKWNLHGTAEVGNGSAEFDSPLYGDGVENFGPDRSRKDLIFSVYSRPEWLDGLQVGRSFLTGDLIAASGLPVVNRRVSSAYEVFIDSKWEFMNEVVSLHHQITDGGYRIEKFRPYLRLQEVNIPNNDPVTSSKGVMRGHRCE